MNRNQWERYETSSGDSIWRFPFGTSLELSDNGQKVFQKSGIFCGIHYFEPFAVTMGFLIKLGKIPVPFYVEKARWGSWVARPSSGKCAVYVYGKEVSMMLAILNDDFVEYVMSLQSD